MKNSPLSPTTGPKPRSNIFGFLDETGLLHSPTDRFFGLGLVILQSPRYMHREIIRLRNQKRFYSEFKFSEISHNNLSIYKNFIDIVLHSPHLRFNALMVDKTKLRSNTNYVKKYNHYAGQLIATSLDQSKSTASEYITVLADDVSTNNIEDKFENIIRGEIRKTVRRNALNGVCRLESHAVTEIQVCDVLVGAVSYANKMSVGQASHNSAKAQFVKHIQKTINTLSLADELNLNLHNGVIFRITKK
jgi:uncharacterized protein YlbG (UPF0298 family)